MKRITVMSIFMLLAAFVGSGSAWAQQKGGIELTAVAEIEAEQVNKEGKKEIKRLPAAKVLPGDEVIYTVYYTNAGREPAGEVVITNPIPQHMVYKEGSASGEGTVITFSVDSGKTYDVPENLTVRDADGKERRAEASEYTHIRWTLQKSLLQDAKGHVSFRAKLE